METARQCCSTTQSTNETICTECYCKSDTNVDTIRRREYLYNTKNKRNANKEYYKKYELDETPVKERADNNIKLKESGKGDRESSLDVSLDLDKLEAEIYNNVSQEQEQETDSSYVPSLDSNLKLFKTAVKEIFDNFYTSMRDFEYYKLRFEEILSKTREDSVGEMEDFIIEMIQHIRSNSSNLAEKNETSVSIESRLSLPFDGTNNESCEQFKPTLELSRNVCYNSDTVSGINGSSDILPKRVLNIYNFSGSRCVQIELNNRDMLSEINIRDSNIREDVVDEVASAENVQKLRAKRLELARLRHQNENEQAVDKEIPVKISNPKKNIHLDEDFSHDDIEDFEQSIFHKICRYLCRKLRKY